LEARILGALLGAILGAVFGSAAFLGASFTTNKTQIKPTFTTKFKLPLSQYAVDINVRKYCGVYCGKKVLKQRYWKSFPCKIVLNEFLISIKKGVEARAGFHWFNVSSTSVITYL
jgi:hypothetical protein